MVAGVLRCVKSLSREFEPTGRRFDPRRGSVESRWAFHRKIGQQIQERMKGSFQEMTKNGFRPPCQRALTDAARGGLSASGMQDRPTASGSSTASPISKRAR